MPIEAKCPGCERTLRVADEHAGKQARCPVCSTIYSVPAGFAPSGSATQADGPLSAAAVLEEKQPAVEAVLLDESQWFMKTPEGQTFGPAQRSEVDRWVTEGRVTGDCELRSDGGTWQPADVVYPVLRLPPAQYAPQQYAPAATAQAGYSPAAATGAYRPSYALPHRGGLILVLALMGFVSGCPILSIMAWVMGHGDLREMREGRMDPEGQGLTQAGYVLGMILSLIWIAAAVIGLFIMLLVAAAGR